ncbi:MAG: dapA2 2 [Devosia sp.]|uniref:dihydrodipicolinate synthase family protein n=1 Tax=Devosia sp. TaxID=1871048 RepID=UPI00261F0D7B|nr:dihydrodipicolinate synthase family protein [Devosia sp.]MDB5527154.1 dapA2 2 [Devosia sp.]
MKTTPVTFADLESSVIAVPPMARNADFTVNRGETSKIIDHIEAGGIRSLMFGGNANFYHLPNSWYAETIDFLADAAGDDTWVLPAIGPDFGKLHDHAAILRERQFPAAMLLPSTAMFTATGVATAIRHFVERSGIKAVIYLKSEGFLTPDLVKALVEDDLICSIKYAVVRQNPLRDDLLARLVDLIDRRYLVSGIGERPVVEHFSGFGLTSFTTGSGVIAPRLAMQLRETLLAKDYERAAEMVRLFIPLEDERDRVHPARVLHDAIGAAGIADTGPQAPLFSGLDASELRATTTAARHLLLEEEKSRALLAA